jgi:hypothetical protein
MRLADDSFELKLGAKTFVLRPTLRAAFTLNLSHDSFQSLDQAIAEGNLSACVHLITATCTDEAAWHAYGMSTDRPVAGELLGARDQLREFLLILAGANNTDSKPTAGKPMPFDEYFTKLFQIGTGWLGWTPDQTWSATPAEILNAREGRMEMLKALFGKRDDDQSVDVADGSLASMRDDLNAIGNLNNHVLGAR